MDPGFTLGFKEAIKSGLKLSLEEEIVLELVRGKIEGFKFGLNEGIRVGFKLRDCVRIFVLLDKYRTEEWTNDGEVDVNDEGDVVEKNNGEREGTNDAVDDRMIVIKVDGTKDGKLDGFSEDRSKIGSALKHTKVVFIINISQ